MRSHRYQPTIRKLLGQQSGGLVVRFTRWNSQLALNRARRLHFVRDFLRISKDNAKLTQVGLLGADWRVMDLENELTVRGNPFCHTFWKLFRLRTRNITDQKSPLAAKTTLTAFRSGERQNVMDNRTIAGQ